MPTATLEPPTDAFSRFADERAGVIYRTAAQMINEKGFDATSMNELAAAVDLTKPGLYYYVKGKKELLFAIMTFALDLLDARVVAPAKAVRDPAERLATIVREHARLLTHERGAIAVLIDEVAGLAPEQREQIVLRKRAYFDLIRDTLDALAKAKRLRRVDTTVAAFSLIGMVMWLSRWYAADGRLTPARVVADVTAIAVAGVLAETPSSPPPSSKPRTGPASSRR